jgi:fatty-acyl-CoA synthase
MEPPVRTLTYALDAAQGIHDRGYTFIASDGGETFYDYDRLREEVILRAQNLRDLGMKPGDRLAMVVPDGIDFVPAFLGALWAGVVPVPLYPPLSIGKLDSYFETLTQILLKAEPTWLLTTDRIQSLIWSPLGKIPSLKGVVTVQSLAARTPKANGDIHPAAPEDLAFLQFTSGSTSTPKGVRVTHASLQANCWAIAHHGARMTPDDVAVSWLPLYHDMGLIGFVLTPIYSTSSVVLMPTLSFVKNATSWLETIHRKRGTLSFAPNFAYALVTKRAKPEQLARWDLSSMRLFGCGAEPIHAQTLQAFAEKFAAAKLKPEAMLPAYGMAEATLAVSFIGLDERVRTDSIDAALYEADKMAAPARRGAKSMEVTCCGRPFPEHDVAVFSPSGHRLPERTVGELALRGPSVADGYFNDPESTAKAFRDGWLWTGDLGYLADGQIYLTGRKKDLIIIHGRNYDPQRIEWLAGEVAGVRKGSTVAFSRPGAETEELVIVAESREREPQSVRAAIGQRVTEQMQLVAADIVLLAPGALPKTSSGKLQRQKTRTQYLHGTLGEGANLRGAAQRWSLAKHFTLSLVGRGRHAARGWLRKTVSRLSGPPPQGAARV